MNLGLTGTGELARLVLRRDRVRLPAWVLGLGGLVAWSAVGVQSVYDTPAKVAGYAATVGTSPVSRLMSGRQDGIDTIGGITANEISQVAQLGVCLMVIFLVVRHTRGDEESGRSELVRSGVVGRHAATLTALLHAVVAALAVGGITAVSMLGVGLGTAGSLAYALGLVLLGGCFAAVALVAAQLTSSARTALALAGAAVGVAYLVRGLGAIRDDALVWLSPFGWAQEMQAFGTERWWPAGLLVVATAALLVGAAWLETRRDHGGALLRPRPGPARASRWLASPLALVLRVQRGALVGWVVGLAALAVIYGAVIPTIPDLLASNPEIGQYIGASGSAQEALVDAFVRYVLLFLAVVSTAFGVACVTRLPGEEESGRGGLVLAAAVSRTRWVGATVAVACAGSLLLLLASGLGLVVGYVLGGGEGVSPAEVVGGQLSYLPAVLVVVGVAVLLVGARPRAVPLAWVVVGAVAVLALLGQSLGLPEGVERVSPFAVLPGVPVEPFDPVPGAVELVVVALLVGVGTWAYRRRDLG
ncbi:exporter of polyketide antibiotics [Janibacter melonis]|uniref:ABC transporter permease n=1 Tax=Janibacter melonis TaxID=262209 RepID=UPI001E2FDE27|nr:hypothetical protein [Janibacter melonis]MCB5990302.1 hypothetical protein [Janibacter melonis]